MKKVALESNTIEESSLHQPDEFEDPPYNVQCRANVRCSLSPQYQGTHEQMPQSQQRHEPLHQATHSGPPQHTQPPSHVVGTSTGATAGIIDMAFVMAFIIRKFHLSEKGSVPRTLDKRGSTVHVCRHCMATLYCCNKCSHFINSFSYELYLIPIEL